MNARIETYESLSETPKADLVLVDTGLTFRGKRVFFESTGDRAKDRLLIRRAQQSKALHDMALYL